MPTRDIPGISRFTATEIIAGAVTGTHIPKEGPEIDLRPDLYLENGEEMIVPPGHAFCVMGEQSWTAYYAHSGTTLKGPAIVRYPFPMPLDEVVPLDEFERVSFRTISLLCAFVALAVLCMAIFGKSIPLLVGLVLAAVSFCKLRCSRTQEAGRNGKHAERVVDAEKEHMLSMPERIRGHQVRAMAVEAVAA